jgi:hypothetical protein
MLDVSFSLLRDLTCVVNTHVYSTLGRTLVPTRCARGSLRSGVACMRRTSLLDIYILANQASLCLTYIYALTPGEERRGGEAHSRTPATEVQVARPPCGCRHQDGQPTLCAHGWEGFTPFRRPWTRMSALDTLFRPNPRTNGTFAAAGFML